MTNTAVRIAIVTVLILAVHGGFIIVRKGGVSEIRSLRGDLTALPMQLGRWNGTQVETDPDIMVATDADVVVDRAYDNGRQRVTLHTNVMTKYFMGLPHHPRHCYDSHGSRLVSEEHVLLPSRAASVAVMEMEVQGQNQLVLYWYQLEDKIIYSGAEQREHRQQLRGQPNWPPLVKVLLQTPCNDRERDQAGLLEFADEVYAWTKNVDRPLETTGPAE